MRYKIGEFARLGGTTVKTLRFYDSIGVLSPAEVDARTRYRFYLPVQLRELAEIRALQELGASLDDIRGANSGSSATRRRLLERLRLRANRSLVATRRSLAWIEQALDGLEHGAPDVAVVLKARACVRVASIRAQLDDYAEIGRVEHDLRCGVDDARTGGLRGVLWHRCEASGGIEGEPFVEIGRSVRRAPGIELKELPRVMVASAFCESDDADAVRTYDAIDRWIHAHDYRIDGPKREIYVGPILEIQFPVMPA